VNCIASELIENDVHSSVNEFISVVLEESGGIRHDEEVAAFFVE